MKEPPQTPPPICGEGNSPLPQRRVWNSADLLQGDKEVLIVHHGEVYRLRETRSGKLLMGK